MPKIKLIIGLGNPDPEYRATYHNVGHLFIDALEKSKIKEQQSKLLKTDVYMNKSGIFVKETLKKEKVSPEELLVVHDDSDIEFGNTKLSFNRSSGGHKGIQNIINHLKTEQFWRLRIGIRPAAAMRATGKKRITADELVLKKITPLRMKELGKIFKEAIKKLEAN